LFHQALAKFKLLTTGSQRTH